MSKITKCPRCGGNRVEPAYPGDGAYPVEPMCICDGAVGGAGDFSNDFEQTRSMLERQSGGIFGGTPPKRVSR